MTPKNLLENAQTLIQAVVRAKPAAAKGKYVKSVTICSTMGPGVALDVTAISSSGQGCNKRASAEPAGDGDDSMKREIG